MDVCLRERQSGHTIKQHQSMINQYNFFSSLQIILKNLNCAKCEKLTESKKKIFRSMAMIGITTTTTKKATTTKRDKRNNIHAHTHTNKQNTIFVNFFTNKHFQYEKIYTYDDDYTKEKKNAKK